VDQTSPFLLVKSLETQVNAILSALDIYSLPADERRSIRLLKNSLVDARLDIREYELSETREEQLRCAKLAKKRLEHVRTYILLASEYNIFGAVDVAQLTANVERISERLL
jgi:hypothetical protein